MTYNITARTITARTFYAKVGYNSLCNEDHAKLTVGTEKESTMFINHVFFLFFFKVFPL